MAILRKNRTKLIGEAKTNKGQHFDVTVVTRSDSEPLTQTIKKVYIKNLDQFVDDIYYNSSIKTIAICGENAIRLIDPTEIIQVQLLISDDDESAQSSDIKTPSHRLACPYCESSELVAGYHLKDTQADYNLSKCLEPLGDKPLNAHDLITLELSRTTGMGWVPIYRTGYSGLTELRTPETTIECKSCGRLSPIEALLEVRG